MINLSTPQLKLLRMYQNRLLCVQRGQVWVGNHPGPYSAEEKAGEIARIAALIAGLEAGEA